MLFKEIDKDSGGTVDAAELIQYVRRSPKKEDVLHSLNETLISIPYWTPAPI